MKPLHRFFLNFSVFFMVGLISNAIIKHNLNVITAFSVALGLSLGILLFGKKVKTK